MYEAHSNGKQKSTFEELKFPNDYLRVKAYQLCGSCNGNCETSPSPAKVISMPTEKTSPSPASQDDRTFIEKMLHGSRNELTITAFIVGGCLLVYFIYHHIYKCANKRTPQTPIEPQNNSMNSEPEKGRKAA